MAVTAQFLRNIMAEARPIIERQMADAKLIAGFRTVVANAGGDWGALKALIKAHVEDENDETGEGKRVQKILEKADSSTAYADMLGLGSANMNENNFSAGRPYAEEKGRGDDVGNTDATDTQEFQAKTSEDNGATGKATMRRADSMAGEVSRSSDRDERGATTSENGRDSRERPALESQSAHVADAVAGGPETPKPPRPVTAEITNPQEPTSSPVKADSPAHSSSHASGTYSPSVIIPAPTDEELEIPEFLRRTDGYAKHGEASA